MLWHSLALSRAFPLFPLLFPVLPITPHLCAALANRTRRVPDFGGHLYNVSCRAEACATVSNHLQLTDPVPPPDIAALARGSSPLTQMRLRPLPTRIRQLAPRGGLRDHLRRFTLAPPRPCAILDCIMARTLPLDMVAQIKQSL
ncbi:hypothetical protein EDB84DRAFT_1596121 [Lactarius hengduanensis]|nr:hypothetical protein EDB84DRAFT_1596121 [Lactarius hengduanensis]